MKAKTNSNGHKETPIQLKQEDWVNKGIIPEGARIVAKFNGKQYSKF